MTHQVTSGRRRPSGRSALWVSLSAFVTLALAGLAWHWVAGNETPEVAVSPDRPLTADAVGEPALGKPIEIRGAERIALPVTIKVDRRKKAAKRKGDGPVYAVRRAPSSRGKSPASAASEAIRYGLGRRWGAWSNIFFVDPDTGRVRLLLDRPAVITRLRFPPADTEPSSGRRWPSVLLLGMHERDTNGDGWVDRRDATVAYVASLGGKNLRRITPRDTDLLDVFYDADRKRLYLRVRRDSNGDGRFAASDRVTVLATSGRDPSKAKPLVGEKALKRVRSIIRGDEE